MQVGIFGLLTIIFVLLKVFEVITWSWWIVFLPLFVGVGLYLLIIAFMLLLAVFVERKPHGRT